MDTLEAFYGQTQQRVEQEHSKVKKRHLILKSTHLELKLHTKHLEVSDGVLSQVYGIAHIEKIYINKNIALSIADVYAISKYVDLYFIDGNGNIVAQYVRNKVL